MFSLFFGFFASFLLFVMEKDVKMLKKLILTNNYLAREARGLLKYTILDFGDLGKS